jgi:hypothetical protein
MLSQSSPSAVAIDVADHEEATFRQGNEKGAGTALRGLDGRV